MMLFSSFYSLRLSRISKNNARPEWFSPCVCSRCLVDFIIISTELIRGVIIHPIILRLPIYVAQGILGGLVLLLKLYASFGSMAVPLETDKNTYAMLYYSAFFPTIHLMIIVPVPLRYPIHVIFSPTLFYFQEL